MTLIVRARIEVDQAGAAQAELRQTAEAVKEVGAAATTATQGANSLSAATDQLAQAQRGAAAAAQQEAVAQDESTRAANTNTTATGRQRAAYQSLGFQVQDVFSQLSVGTNVLIILAQQGGQIASAFAEMGNAAEDATQTGFQRFAAFLAGPWGAAVFGAVVVGGLLVQSLNEQEEAAKAATLGADGLSEAQAVLGRMFDETSGKLERQNELLVLNARLTAINLRAEALAQRESARETFDKAGQESVGGFLYRSLIVPRQTGRMPEQSNDALRLASEFQSAQDILKDPRARIKAFDDILRRSEKADFTGLAVTAVDIQQALLNAIAADSKEQTASLVEKTLADGVLAPELRRKPSADKPDKSDASSNQAEKLLDFAAATAERVQRINESFDDQPRLIDQAAKASRELDSIQAEVEKRLGGQPDKVRELTAAIGAARGSVEDALLRPFREMEEAGNRQLDQMMLIAQGRDAEAEALARIQQYQERFGDLTEEQRLAVLAQVEAERELGRLIEDRGRKLSIYNASIDDTRAALEDLLSGGSGRDFLKSMEQNFKQLQGRLLTEQLFGDALRELEDFASGRTSLKTQTERLVEDLAKPGPVANRLAEAMDEAATRISEAAQRIANPGLVAAVPNAVPANEGVVLSDGSIRVTGNPVGGDKPVEVTFAPTALQFMERTWSTGFKTALKPLESLIGTKLFNGLGDVFGGAMAGRAQGGDIGAILGGLKSIEGLPDGLKKVLGGADGAGGAFGGAVAGFRTSQFMDALGIGNSKSGAALGGAIGSAIPIPGADIIGSIAGGLLGQALKPTKRGSATITSVDGNATSRGNDQERIQASLGLAGGVQQRLRQIADEFDAEIGSFAVSIGQRGKDFRVDTSGSGKTKTKRGAIDFGQDEEAAIAFALRDALSDGAIKGLSAAIQKALNSNPDVDRAIKEALKVRDVEELLEGIGGKLQKEVRDFDRQADERLRIARDYGFDIVEIERINAEERSKIIEDILQDRVGALQDLLNDLVFGDLAEGTLSERRQRLLEEIGKAEADAAKGVDGAAQRLADLNRRLIDLSRDAYGTAGGEYASDRAQAIASAERIIQIENDRIRGSQEAAAETNRQLAVIGQLSNEQNDILAQINAGIRSLVSLDGLNIAGGGGGNAGIDLGAIMRQVDLK